MKGLIFDIDGVLLRGDTPVPGAVAALQRLAADGYRLGYLSNDSASSAGACAARLAPHGFPVDATNAMTAAVVAARFARDHLAGERVFVVGMPAMVEAFTDAGVSPEQDPNAAEAFIMGRDEAFTYARLVVLMRLVQRLGRWYATGLDARLPVGDGQFVPGAGAMITAVAHASGVKPEVLGKPSHWAAEAAAGMLGLAPSEVAMVGDSPTQDIAMGTSAGMRTVLVLTGSATRADVDNLRPPEQPDLVLESVSDLSSVLHD